MSSPSSLDNATDFPRDGELEELLRLEAELEGGEPADGDLDALLAGVRADVSQERGPLAWLRSRPSWLRIALGVLACAVLTAAWSLAGGADISAQLLARMGALVILVVAVLSVALRPLQARPLPSWSRAAALGLAVVLPATLALTGGVEPPEILAHSLPHAMTCFTIGAVMALPVVLLLAALDRGGSRAGTVALAASAGIGANILLEARCEETGAIHNLAGHITIIVLYAAAASLVVGFRDRRPPKSK